MELYATYSSTEMGATFSECEYGCGGHVHPELIIVEIIGDDNMPVPDGEPGEIVVTTLGVEGMPLLRFRTGDIAAKVVDRCACGRYSYRLTPIDRLYVPGLHIVRELLIRIGFFGVCVRLICHTYSCLR